MKKYELTHARHDPAHCLAPGLFRSLKKGDYKRLKLDISYEFSEGEKLEFKAAEPLGVTELRILQGLIAMAGPSGLLLTSEPKTESGQQLRLLLDTKFDAVTENAMVVKGSYRALAREIGYGDIEDARGIKEAIERLWGVSVIAEKNRKRRGYRLLADYASDDADGRLYVALNPRIAAAILGEAQHCRIDMHEVRAIKGDSTRLIHQRLSGWIDTGKSGRIGIDTLCGYAWPNEATPNTMKQRRTRAKAALAELAALGWNVNEYTRGKFEISRPPPPRLTVPNPPANCTRRKSEKGPLSRFSKNLHMRAESQRHEWLVFRLPKTTNTRLRLWPSAIHRAVGKGGL